MFLFNLERKAAGWLRFLLTTSLRNFRENEDRFQRSAVWELCFLEAKRNRIAIENEGENVGAKQNSCMDARKLHDIWICYFGLLRHIMPFFGNWGDPYADSCCASSSSNPTEQHSDNPFSFPDSKNFVKKLKYSAYSKSRKAGFRR